jgi:gliding motility-associated-like protein
MEVYVYPTFAGGILSVNGCQGVPLQFTDSTSTTYGYINSWYWTFANLGFSNVQNPVFSFDSTGTFLVTLIVGNTVGCVDTVTTYVTIYPQPIAQAFSDSTICYLDTIQLFGSGDGSYLWTPDYNISNDTSANPFISPDVNTNYILTVENQWGCLDKDTVHIEVINAIIATAGPDTTLCPGESVQLYSSGGWNFSWSPNSGLSNSLIPDPIATPGTTTIYILTTSIGSCSDSAFVNVQIKPLPQIATGPDQQICIGDSVMIDACCGTNYLWSPAFSLSNATISNPIAFPTVTTDYSLVASDSNGCLITVYDNLLVTVIIPSPLITTPDTIMYLGTTADLYCLGAQYYQWIPETYLSDANVSTPAVTPGASITYIIYATTSDGCKVSDSVAITLVEDPLVVVPNAFTPNLDGINDEFLPIIQGLFVAEIFMVFNRWGELVYSTTDITKGWDGKRDGKNSEMGTYVYYLKGRSATTGLEYFVKGNVVLLR